MIVDLTGNYSLDSIKNVSKPPAIPPDWKWKAVYNKLRGRAPAVLYLEQGSEIPGRERYALLGTLKAGKSEFVFKGTARMNQPIGALFDAAEYGTETTGRLQLKDEGVSMEVKVCINIPDIVGTLEDLLICKFLVVSRPAKRDGRLVGQWHWSEFYSSGDFSTSVHRFMVFGPGGRVIDSVQSFASLQLRGPDGSWSGLNNIASRVPASDRGTWSADGRTLRIVWDDGRVSEFRYEMDRDGMLWRWSGGQKYWAKA
jgi:hypothetical protein